jgi:hypothetical protein
MTRAVELGCCATKQVCPPKTPLVSEAAAGDAQAARPPATPTVRSLLNQLEPGPAIETEPALLVPTPMRVTKAETVPPPVTLIEPAPVSPTWISGTISDFPRRR